MIYTLKELYNLCKKELSSIEDYEFETLVLMEHFFDVRKQDIILFPDKNISESKAFFDAIKKRKERYPLQYILGYWHFGNLTLRLNSEVLIPREDTLVLVDEATSYIGDKSMTGLDLCSGTGAVALAICDTCKNSKIDAIELYPMAFDILCENVKNIKPQSVKAINGDVFDFDLIKNYNNLDFIVSNPPYIETGEIAFLQEEVKKEPVTALDGGNDGLIFYDFIIKNYKDCLKKGGLLAFEIGESQGEDVKNLLKLGGFKNIRVIKDLSGHDRVVLGYL